MPPAPITATVLPGSTWAVRNTAPMPVSTRAADERGPVERDVVGDLHHRPLVHEHLLGEPAEAGELARSTCRRRATAAGVRSRGAADRSVRCSVRVAGQARRALAAEHRQAAHDVVAGLARSATPAPTASTTPADSWPSTAGTFVRNLPSMKWRSLWHSPAADGRSAPRPAWMVDTRSSINSSPGCSLSTAALIADPAAPRSPEHVSSSSLDHDPLRGRAPSGARGQGPATGVSDDVESGSNTTSASRSRSNARRSRP